MSDAVPEADTDPLARPSWACVLCPPPRTVGAWRQADQNFVTCQQCDEGLRERLDDVARRYLRLDARPGGSGEYGSRGAPGFGSRPPLSLHVAALRDPRSSQDSKVWVGRDGRVHQEQERPVLSVHGTLSIEAWSIAEHRAGIHGDVAGPDDRADVFELLRFIERHLSYAARHAELVVDLDRAVRDLLGQLRPVTGDARRRIGNCPAKLVVQAPGGGEGEATDAVCNATLHGPLAGYDSIRCYTCGAEWGYADWLQLGNLLTSAASAA